MEKLDILEEMFTSASVQSGPLEAFSDGFVLLRDSCNGLLLCLKLRFVCPPTFLKFALKDLRLLPFLATKKEKKTMG